MLIRPMRRCSVAASFALLIAWQACGTASGQTLCADGHYPCDADCPGCRAFLEGMQPAPVVDAPLVDQLPADPTMAPPATGAQPDFAAPPAADLAPSAVGVSDLAAAGPGLAPSFGATGAGYGAVPSMIGDFFGSGYNYSPTAFIGDQDPPQDAVGATPTPAGGDRILKRSENFNPFPQDRFFFNYHHFHNALIDTNLDSYSLNRYTFGLEKTFLQERYSLELRVPFAGTISATQNVLDPDTDATEFGNLQLAFKGLLYNTRQFAVAAGLGLVFPTGRDSKVVRDFNGQSQTLAEFANESYLIQPYLGLFYQPRSRWFNVFLLQCDFDATGSTVTRFSDSGKLQSQSLLFLDYSTGYWVYRNPCQGCLTGIAPMIELHYTTTMQDLDLGPFGGRNLFVEDLRRDVLNLTGGLFFEFGRSTLNLAAVVPLRDGTDKLFDTELGAQFVRRF
jgi:hypothetical protein